MNRTIVFLGFVIFFFIQGCQKFEHQPLFDNFSAPEPVKNIQVKNTPGGAVITYSLPSGTDLMYVVATVKDHKGDNREFKSSFYDNSIAIVGLGDTTKYKVTLVSVSKSEKRSKPVETRIKPLAPPYLDIFESVKLKADFGGVNVSLKNIDTIPIGISLVGTDSLGVFGVLDTYFSERNDLTHTFRKYPTEERKYGVFIKDKWGNTSDTIYKMITPLFEEMLDKSKFKDITLDNDTKIYETSELWNIDKKNIWDGYWSSDFSNDGYYGNYLNFATHNPDPDKPSWFTFDLGVVANISRVWVKPYWRFESKAMRRFEIWGKETVDGSGDWEGWTKLSSYTVIKPSGLPPGQNTDADAEAWIEGWNMDVIQGAPSVRYIRVKCLENWRGDTNLSLFEISLWGQVVN